MTLDVGLRSYDHDEAWISLSPQVARALAACLLAQAAALEEAPRPAPEAGAEARHTIDVRHAGGDAYTVEVRGHALLTDQPADSGGTDRGTMPTELFVASLASCVAFYAGRFLDRHGVPRRGLRVTAEFDMAADRPARVSAVRLRVTVPEELPESRRAALRAVAEHCTVHNSLRQPPQVTVDLMGPSSG
ncbi:OsmC family protein [Acrocarpospora catenulata]|uniref:OsmC family protein n=1 Tax=Acrocarpospora catenulata TaxID=2836182 RepID=UPI0027DF9E6D|nr:OsmC family protein [Acrocarpospora catenulata]